MAKAARRWSSNNKPPNKINQPNGDSGFNESTDTTLITPPNGKINFESEKTVTFSNKKSTFSKHNQVMPEVILK